MKLLYKAGGVLRVQSSLFIAEGGMMVELQHVVECVCVPGHTENNKCFWYFFELKFKRNANKRSRPATENKQGAHYSVSG